MEYSIAAIRCGRWSVGPITRRSRFTAMAEARTATQRITDTLQKLVQDREAWVASTDAHRPWLVPLWFLWHDGRLVFAIAASSATARDLSQVAGVRIALGHPRDVVIIEGDAALAPSSAMTIAELAAYQAKHDSDPRAWADTIFRVRPRRIQAWREENENSGRTLMRGGQWLAS